MSLKQSKSFHMLATFVAAVVVLSLAGATPALAQSCTDSWTGGGGDGLWSDPANWSTGMVPGSSDTTCIATSGAAVSMGELRNTPILNLALGSGDSLTLPAGGGLSIGGTSIANGGQIIFASSNTSELLPSSGGTVTLSGGGTVTLNSSANDSITGTGPGGTLVNQETIQGAGGIGNDIILNNSSGGVVNANQSGAQLVVGRFNGTGTNTGLMEATNGGQLVMGSLTLNNVGGTIMASGKNSYVQVEGEGAGGETFTGGTWTTANGGVIQVFDPAALLDGTNGNTITNSGTMQLIVGRGGNFQGTVNNTGTISILSSSTASTNLGIPAGQTFTLMGTGNLTMGDGTANAYNNQNGIGGGTLVNEQLIQGTGAIQNLTGFSNSGTINANIPTGPNNLQLVLGRAGASTNTGTIEATNGGVLVIGSTTITNTGGTIEAEGANSNVTLVGSLGTSGLTISGGTFKTSSGGVIYTELNTTLDGTDGNTITNAGTLAIPDAGRGSSAQGTLNNTGTFEILSTGDSIGLGIPAGQTLTLTGTGNLTMGDGTDNAYNNQNTISGGTFVNQQLIQGTGAIQELTGLTNSGTINANVPTGPNNLQLSFGYGVVASTNTGTIEATNGGTLTIYNTSLANTAATIKAEGAHSNVTLSGATISGGTYTTSDGGAIYGEEGATLDGTTDAITNSGTLIVDDAVGNPPRAFGQGTLKNTGTIEILSKGGFVYFGVPTGETLTLTGSGKVIMGDGTNNSYNNQPTLGGGGGTLINQTTIEGAGVIGGAGTQGFTNEGTINADVPVGTAGVTMNIEGAGASGTVNRGTMEASKGSLLQITGASFNNIGTLNAASDSTIDIHLYYAPFLNLVSGTLTGGTYKVTGTLEVPGNITANDANITLTGTASQILNPNTNALAGFVTNGSKGSFTLAGDQGFTSAGTFTNQGAIAISKGSTFTVGSGESYVQSGGKTTVDGELTTSGTGAVMITKGSLFGNGGNIAAGVTSSGTVIPADATTSVGKLTITGAYTQSSAGALDANIAGAESGQFNLLNVTGTATLGGDLNLKLLKSFVPLVGATFEILTAEQLKGTFAKVNGTAINSSEHFTVTYNSNNVTLTVVSGT